MTQNTIQTMDHVIDSLQKVMTNREYTISRSTSELNAMYETTGTALTATKYFPMTPNAETIAAIEQEINERREKKRRPGCQGRARETHR
jgi:regulator of protease activity HflC (stomatin/prohibitin superfamily)